MIWLWVTACSLELQRTVPDPPADPIRVQDLWELATPDGVEVHLDDLVVTSPRTAAGTTFYVQQRGGGPAGGLQVQLGDGIRDWPPPVGTPIALTGTWLLFAGGPTLWLKDQDDLRVLGQPEDPIATPWSDDPTLVWSLVSAEGVQITSSVDPTGLADTSLGQLLRADFDVPTPGWGRSGDLLGINALGSAILLRTEADWNGGWEEDPPLDALIPELADLPEGTPVRIADVVQATRWSRSDRWTVLQDLDGNGLWVDTEGFGRPDSVVEQVGTWTGEVRHTGGLHLRVWIPSIPSGAERTAIRWTGEPTEAPDAAILTTEVGNLGGIGARGDRSCDDWLLDNRFEFLGGLTDPDTVLGVVLDDGADLRRLVVLALL